MPNLVRRALDRAAGIAPLEGRVKPAPLSGGAAFLVDTILNSDPRDVQQAFRHLGLALRTDVQEADRG